MIWPRHNDYAVKSQDGRFSICRVNIGARIDYELWLVRGNTFLSARRDVRNTDACRLTAINELKGEADEYVKREEIAKGHADTGSVAAT